MKSIQFLIPVFNEEQNLNLLQDYLDSIIKKVNNKIKKDIKWSILFSDNCSSDNSLSKLSEIKFPTKNLSVIPFAHNYGFSYATSYLVYSSTGDFIVLIPADMQVPIETIVKGITKSVSSNRSTLFCRKSQESRFLTHSFNLFFKKIFYKLLNLFQKNTYKGFFGMGCFSTSDINFLRKKSNATFFPFQIRIFFPNILYKPYSINFIEKERLFGISGFNFFKYVKEAFSIFLRSSFINKNGIQTLLIIVLLGFLLLSISIILFKIFLPSLILPGFTTLILLVLFSSALNVLSIYLLWLKIETKTLLNKPVLKRK